MSVANDSRRQGGFGILSDDKTDDGLFRVTGVALGSNDVTRGALSGSKKLWTPEVLEEAADTLRGKEIVVDHENRSSLSVIGEVLESKFEEGKGVVYKGVIDNSELAQKIEHGWLSVSPRIIHSEEMEEEGDLKIPQSIRKFDNLSVVNRGASSSATVQLGEPEELQAELESTFEEDDDVVAEYQEVQSDGGVDLSKWLYDNPNGAIGATRDLGCSGSHKHEIEGETWYGPCDSHEDFLKNLAQKQRQKKEEEEEMEQTEELQISEARRPNYSGTEEASWGDISADQLSYWVDALGYEDVEETADLTQEQKQEIANHTLLGDPEADSLRELRFFPVVNAETGSLNRGALEAVRGGRGQSADVPSDTYESAYRVAGNLLNEEFDSDVEVELSKEELSAHEERKRMAGQMSSVIPLTRDEALGLLAALNPDRPDGPEAIADAVARSFDVDRDGVLRALQRAGVTKTPSQNPRSGNASEMDEDNDQEHVSPLEPLV